MIDERELLEHAMRRFEPEPGFTDRIYHRRDRKRRNQRIAAGVVGIAVFVAAVWAVTSVSSLDRSEEVVVPAVSGTTGPTKTEPTKTEPTGPEEEPITQASPNPDDVWRKDSLGAGRDEVVAYYVDHYVPFVYVYADGRVLSATRSAPYVKERRLTPEGVDLVQSGAVGPYSFIGEGTDLPEGAWADDASKRYVPSRYSVCFQNRGKPGNRGDGGFENPSTVLRFFPASAQAILGGEVTILQDNPYASGGDTRRCSVVSPEEKHALHRIMGEPGRHVTVTDSEGNKIMWWIRALLPHGDQVPCLPCF